MFIVESKSSNQRSLASRPQPEIGHSWITVVNPTNHRSLLQACDNCGVVKSENSITKRCRASQGQAIVSGRMAVGTGLTG